MRKNNFKVIECNKGEVMFWTEWSWKVSLMRYNKSRDLNEVRVQATWITEEELSGQWKW